MSTPPPIGKRISVVVDQQAYDDLTAMLATGMTVSDAVRSALHIVAGIYRKTWDARAVPEDTRPDIARFWITRCDPGQWPAPGTAQTTVPSVYWLRETPGPISVTARPTPRIPPVGPDTALRKTGLPPSHPLLLAGPTTAPEHPTPIRQEGA